ncbi:MAG: acyltransferase family protein [Bacteroidota bacterium]
MELKKERDVSLDLMRFLGILVIMVAHADPPGWLYQLRNFGTPLLIITSALTHSLIYQRKKLEVKPFLRKRLSRIVFPAWIFLTFFYPFLYFVTRVLHVDYPFKFIDILLSYPLYSGFVWIFKVYFILALITPFSLAYRKKVTHTGVYMLILILAWAFHEASFYFTEGIIGKNYRDFFDNVIFVIIPYSVLYLYGFKLGELSKRTVLLISIVSGLVFAGIAFYLIKTEGSFVQTQVYKYPPRLYYIAYSFIAIHIIYLFRHQLTSLFNRKAIVWLSSKSLWIYLWHILAYYLWDVITGGRTYGLGISIVGSVFLLFFSVLLTYIQTYLAERYLLTKDSRFYQKLGGYLT